MVNDNIFILGWSKAPFTPRTITINITTSASTLVNDIVCILSAHASVSLNSPTHYSRMDSDWLSVFLSFINKGGDSNYIVSLCLYRYSYIL